MSASSSPSSSVPTTPTGQKRLSYAAGKVYAVRCTLEGHENLCYVGSTTTTLAKRLYQHRKTSEDITQTRRLYEAMRELGAANWCISLLEDAPCERREQLRAREEHHRRELGAELNMVRAYVSNEEILDERRERNRQWKTENRNAHIEYCKAYRADLRTTGFPCTVCNHIFNQPHNLKAHLSTRRHQVAAMKAHLTTLFREARAAHHARTVATFQTRLTTALVATVAEREAYRSQLTA